RRDDREARNRRQRAPPDLEMDQGRSHRRRQTAGKRNRYGTGATDKSPPGKYLPSLRTRRMVRGGGKAPAERGSLRDPFCRRCHPVLPAQGGRGKGVEGFTEAVREERFNSAPGEDAADGIWALCDGECEEAGEETRNLRFPRLYAYLHTQPQGQVHSAREDGSQTVPERTEGDRRLVPTTPARPCEQTAENAECQAPRPLPVLRTIDELPQSLAVLPESLSYLAHVAESAHARDNADVGEICRNPAPVPVVATSDHALLDGSGESRLKNPLREICTAGSVRGENQMSHGGPKRARSWKRRTEPRKAYRSWRSPLLGGLSTNRGCSVSSGPQPCPQHDCCDSGTTRDGAGAGAEAEDDMERVSEPAVGDDCGHGFLHGSGVDAARFTAVPRAVLHRLVYTEGGDRRHRTGGERIVDEPDRPESHGLRRWNPDWKTVPDSR